MKKLPLMMASTLVLSAFSAFAQTDETPHLLYRGHKSPMEPKSQPTSSETPAPAPANPDDFFKAGQKTISEPPDNGEDKGKGFEPRVISGPPEFNGKGTCVRSPWDDALLCGDPNRMGEPKAVAVENSAKIATVKTAQEERKTLVQLFKRAIVDCHVTAPLIYLETVQPVGKAHIKDEIDLDGGKAIPQEKIERVDILQLVEKTVSGEETKLMSSVAREALSNWKVAYSENEDFAKYLKTRFKLKPRFLHYTGTYAGSDLGEDGKRMSGTYETGYVYYDISENEPSKPASTGANGAHHKAVYPFQHPEGKGRRAQPPCLDEDAE